MADLVIILAILSFAGGWVWDWRSAVSVLLEQTMKSVDALWKEGRGSLNGRLTRIVVGWYIRLLQRMILVLFYHSAH